MAVITIVREWNSWIVCDGMVKGSREYFIAAGLSIYLKGACPVSEYPRVANIACNEAISRHIPAMSLRRVK